MSERSTVPAAGIWGDKLGYSRAVRVGQTIHVSGTTAPGADLREQTAGALAIAVAAITELGGAAEDVVRTRLYVTDIEQWELAAAAHGAVFGAIKPANTTLEVSRLIDPSLLVEVELEALVPAGR